jgi:hypothetical protein
MAFSLDPQQLVSNAITKIVDACVIVGMPTKENPVPIFILCEITAETAHAIAKLPGNATQTGELKSRSVIEPSTLDVTAVLSDFDGKDNSTFKIVSTALAGIGNLVGQVASFGAVLPNLSGLTLGYVSSQIQALNQMKNNMMPIMILGNYFSLGVLVQTTPYLLSKWYIEEFTAPHDGAKAGSIVTIKVKEQVEPRDTSLLKGGLKAVMGEIGSPLAGQTMGLFF